MTFTVTYRGADGALREERVEAAGRGECFAQCRARGIAPLSVKEGNPVSRRGAEARRGKMGGKGLFSRNFTFYILHFTFAIAVVAAMAVVWWWLGRSEEQPTPEPKAPEKPSALAKEVKPAAAPKTIKAEKPALADAPEREKPQPSTNETDRSHMVWHGKKVRSWDVTTNGITITEMVVTDDDGRRHRIESRIPGVIPTGTDQLLLMSLSDIRGDGAPMPSMGEGSDEAFLESLKIPITVNDGDSDEVRRIKETLIAARAEMKEMLGKGWTFKGVLSEHVEQAKANTALRIEASREYRKLSEGGDQKAADEFLEGVNAVFRKNGIEEVKPPRGGGRQGEVK